MVAENKFAGKGSGVKEHATGANIMIWLVVAFGGCFWILESAIHAFAFGDGNLAKQIFAPSISEAWMRLLVICILAAFGFYAQSTIDRRRQSKQPVEMGEKWFFTALKSIGDAVIVTDQDGCVTFMNPVAQSLTGWKAESAEGKPLEEVFNIVNEETGEPVDNPATRAIREGVIVGLANHTVLIDKDGTRRPIDDSGAPIKNDEGEVVGAVLVFRDITERKKVEDELKNSRERLEIIFEYAPDAYYLSDLNGIFIDGNIAAEKMTGYKRKELIGKSFLDLGILLAEQVPKAASLLAENALGKRTGPDEIILNRRNGAQIITEISTYPVKIDGQTLVLGIAREVTDRKRTVEALRESEEKYRVLVENANEAILVAQDDRLKFVNPRTVELTGYSEDELLSKSFVEFVHPDDRETVMERYLRKLKGEETPHSYSFRIIAKDGGIMWMQLHAVLVSWQDRPATLNFLSDVTESMRLTRELQQSRDHLKGLLENANDIIITCDKTGTILSANKMALEVGGHRAEDLQDLNIFDIVFPEFVDAARQWADQNVLGEKTSPILQLDFKGANGERIPVEASLNTIESEGEVIGVQTIARDLRPRIEAERQIRELQRLNEQIIHNATLGIVTIDRNGIFTSINPAFGRVLGRDSVDDLLGRNFFDLPGVKKFHFGEALKEVLEGQTQEQTIEFRTVRTGKDVKLKVFGTPLPDERGEIQGALLIMADLSRERELEKQLIQSEKLSSIGSLVSGVAHELNNPLTAIMGYSQLLSISRDLSEKSLDMAEKILSSSERCKRIVENLLSFSRRKLPEKSIVDINELLEQTLELRGYDLRVNNIEVIKNYSSRLSPTAGDPHQLQQVFLNLINNAYDAMREISEQGTIEIRTYESPDGFINIEFIDDGPGVNESVWDKIFDPFVTTKPVGKGTGLGLSLSYGIMQAHGGSIRLDGSYREGAKFIIRIPVDLTGAQPALDLSAEGNPAGATRHILLVDDEEQILDCVKMLLEKHFYRVTTASDGTEAMRMLDGQSFDVVVTDLRMPGDIDGKTLYHLIVEKRPEMADKVLFITGDTMDPETQAFFKKLPNRHVKKPFTSQELVSSIAAVIGV